MTKPKSHTIAVGDFTLEVGLDEHRILLDLTQLLGALHRDYGQKEAEAKYAYAQADKFSTENRLLREALEAFDSKLEVESSFEEKGQAYVAFYRVPAGPWHKILAIIRGGTEKECGS